MNVRVQYDCTPIRHIAVQCPDCGNWFNGRHISSDYLYYEYQISRAHFACPLCLRSFSGKDSNIENCDSDEKVYMDCKERREVWE